MFMTARDVAEVECPQCGHTVEFWPDELMRECRRCGHRFRNPDNTLKCLEWCRYASQCMAALQESGDAWVGPLREELVERMKRAFGDDRGRIEHALAVLEVSEQVGREEGANPMVLVPAAVFHDIGRGASAGGGDEDHGEVGGRTAAELIEDIGFPPAVVKQILRLIEAHHERAAMAAMGPTGAVLFDADLIVNLEGSDEGDPVSTLEREALTEPGVRIGRRRLTP
jgi:putative nucleotidyltransferase with HDIG domain